MDKNDTPVEICLNDLLRLDDLVGLHKLTGVEMGRADYEVAWYGLITTNYIKFCLDDVCYVVVENPEDGYRSSMDAIYVTNEPCRTQIPPTTVVGIMREDTDNEHFNVLDLLDVETNDVVLSVGTGNTGDYYPYFVSYWNPAGLKWNQ